jgi:hypothetical protein
MPRRSPRSTGSRCSAHSAPHRPGRRFARRCGRVSPSTRSGRSRSASGRAGSPSVATRTC